VNVIKKIGNPPERCPKVLALLDSLLRCIQSSSSLF
jgi:hypothetical protein